jgi:geranylgeranyl diphosphate synthase type II
MALALRVEAALKAAIDLADTPAAPPLLIEALRYAVFPGGARVRPLLCLAVAQACGDDQPALSDAAAAAVELLHCASLVHDDLPCFDNAGTRRGKPSVHAVYGEPIALLAGDALIVMAFERLALAGALAPARLSPLITTVTRGVGAPSGIVAGQAWAADDLLDAVQGADCDKPVGQDALLKRPSVVAEHGVQGALAQLNALVEQAVESVPPCEGAQDMRALVRMTAMRLAPKELVRSAA